MNQYAYLTGFPQRLSDFLHRYDAQRKAEAERAEKERQDLVDRYYAEREKIKADFEQEQKLEQQRLDSWEVSLHQYESRISAAQTAFEKQIIECAKDATGIAGVTGISNAWSVLQNESSNLGKRAPDYNAPLKKLNEKQNALLREAQHSIAALRQQVKSVHEEAMELLEQKRNDAINDCLERERAALVAQQEEAERRVREMNDRMILGFDEELKPAELKQVWQAVCDSVPKYKGYQPSKTRGSGLTMGKLRFDVTEHMRHELKKECLLKKLSFLLKNQDDRFFLEIPAGCAFEDQAFSSVIAYDNNTRADAVSAMRSLAMQLLMSNPLKKTRFTFFSPSDSGDAFAMFSRLASADERIIDTRVWCNEKDIEEHLSAIQRRAEEINLNYLQGNFDSLLEYNEKAGKNAEPLQFLFVVDFPRNFTENALKYLEGIMSNGPKNGIYTILAGHDNELNGSSDINDAKFAAILKRICGGLSNYSCTAKKQLSPFCADGKRLPFEPALLPENKEEVDQTMNILCEGIAHTPEIVVDYDDISENLTRKPERWFQFSDWDGLEIPFALTGANKALTLDLASDPLNPCFHTLIGGQIGSGKSVLLHTIISNVLMRYSPEDVQMYLMDFKDGVEFKIYADYSLQNFRAVSIETEPEFGLAVLRHLSQEMSERSKRFREENVETIGSYRRSLAQKGIIHHHMPRILLIIDEYQSLLGDPSDPVHTEAAQLIKEFATKGRAFGIYMIMATQDTMNAKALPAEVYNQFSNRIALKSNPASAELILPGNPACEKVVSFNPGQAIFNSMLGDKDHNVSCRIAYLGDAERRNLLARIQMAQNEMFSGSVSGIPPRLLLSGVQDDPFSPLNRFARTGEAVFDMELGYRLFMGEALAMVNNFQPVLSCARGQNLLLLGNDQARARETVGFAVASLIAEAIRQGESPEEPIVTLFDFSTGFHDDLLQQICDRLPHAVRRFAPEGLLSGLEILRREMPQGRRQFVVFFGLSRARRLTMMGNAYTGGSAKDTLMDLLREGPENGMNFIVWANSVEGFNDHYAAAMGLFEHRLVGNIGEDDYKTFLGESAPRSMSNNNAVYFNADALDSPKVRLYSSPTQNWINDFLSAAERWQ